MTYDLAPEDPASPEAADVPELDSRLRFMRRRSAIIEKDMPCVRCGYNLRTLARRGRCPECGAPVVVSEAGDDLLSASPEWLRVMRRGLALLLWSFGLSVATVVVPAGLQGAALGLVVRLLALFGILLITTTEPRDRVDDKVGGLRSALRWGSVLLCGSSLMAAGGHVVGANATVLMVVDGINALLSIGVIIGLSFFLAGFARRMTDVDLERQTVTVMWGLVGAVAAMAVFVPLLKVLPVSSQGPAYCASLAAGLAFVGLLLWFLNLLFRYHGVIKWVAHEAQHRLDEERGK